MIEFKHKSPGFKAAGTEPPESLKTDGFQKGYKPPAGFFNWFWTLVSNCITEIQTILKGMAKDDLSNVDDAVFLDKAVNAGAGGVPIVDAISTDGVAYTATVDGVTELKNGLLVTIIPNMTSTSRSVTINVNGLGDKMIRVPLSFNTAAMDRPKLETFFVEGRPTMIQFDANYIAGGLWKTVEKQKNSAQDLYGTVPVESGGTGAADAPTALKNLGLTATAEELNFMDGVTENVQTQIDRISTDIGNVAAEALQVTGAASSVVVNNLAGSRALVSDANGKIGVSPVTSTELGYLDGVKSNVQTQIDGKLGSSANAASASKLANARTIRTNLGSTSTASFDGSANVTPGVTGTLPISNGGTGATDAATARTKLGITPDNIGASPIGHKHKKSEITDFPTSMPASDVSAWAKAASKPTYTAEEVGAVKKSGDTMTGKLAVKDHLCINGTGWRSLVFQTVEEVARAEVQIDGDNRFVFNEYETGNPYPDRFYLPKPTVGKEGEVWNEILTSRSPETAVNALWAEIAKKIEATYNVAKK